MNAIDLLMEDHRKVKGLFTEFEQSGERAHQTRRRIAAQVFQELETHTRLEEEIFYPAVRDQRSADAKEMIAESVEEHHVVDMLIAELKRLSPEDEQYEAKFTVLTENVKHHIEEEEGELFPKARRALGKELDRLGTEMEQRRQRLMAGVR
jgi:hemerythrin-like domain-containing protein